VLFRSIISYYNGQDLKKEKELKLKLNRQLKVKVKEDSSIKFDELKEKVYDTFDTVQNIQQSSIQTIDKIKSLPIAVVSQIDKIKSLPIAVASQIDDLKFDVQTQVESVTETIDSTTKYLVSFPSVIEVEVTKQTEFVKSIPSNVEKSIDQMKVEAIALAETVWRIVTLQDLTNAVKNALITFKNIQSAKEETTSVRASEGNKKTLTSSNTKKDEFSLWSAIVTAFTTLSNVVSAVNSETNSLKIRIEMEKERLELRDAAYKAMRKSGSGTLTDRVIVQKMVEVTAEPKEPIRLLKPEVVVDTPIAAGFPESTSFTPAVIAVETVSENIAVDLKAISQKNNSLVAV